MEKALQIIIKAAEAYANGCEKKRVDEIKEAIRKLTEQKELL